MLARDGATILEDANDFGQEWQVHGNEPMLFHSLGDGVHYPQVCVMPNTAIGMAEKRRRLGESMITEEDAFIACAHADEENRDACVFDVLATNDKELAGAY